MPEYPFIIGALLLLTGCSGGPGRSTFKTTHVWHDQIGIIQQENLYPWSTRSKYLFTGMLIMNYLDAHSSWKLDFGEERKNGGHFDERNPLLSEHPSDSEIALLKGGVVLSTVLLAEILPEHRDVIFLVSGLIGGLAAGNNYYLDRRHR